MIGGESSNKNTHLRFQEANCFDLSSKPIKWLYNVSKKLFCCFYDGSFSLCWAQKYIIAIKQKVESTIEISFNRINKFDVQQINSISKSHILIENI